MAFLACHAFGERQELRCRGTLDDIAVSEDRRAAPSLQYDLHEDSVRSLAEASIAACYQPQRTDRAHLLAAPTLGGRALEATLRAAFEAR